MSRVDSEDPARCPSLSCGTYLMLGKRTRKGHAQGSGREGEKRGPPPARGGAEAGPTRCTILGAARLAEPSGHPIWPGFFWRRGRGRGQLGWGAGGVPGTSVASSLCASPVLIASSLGAACPGALAPAGGGVRLPGGLGERARRLGRARQMTGVIYIASTWVLLLAVASTFPVRSSGEKAGRHFAADNEILAANCSRGRCPSGKAREEGSERWRGREDSGRPGRAAWRRRCLPRLPGAH